MSTEIKQTFTLSVPIVDVMLDSLEGAARKAINAKMKELGIPDGTPIQVDVTPRKYDYEVRATW